jgi:hypothetical protein
MLAALRRMGISDVVSSLHQMSGSTSYVQHARIEKPLSHPKLVETDLTKPTKHQSVLPILIKKTKNASAPGVHAQTRGWGAACPPFSRAETEGID